MQKIDESILSEVIHKRPDISYKGNYGRILIIAGSTHFGGAALMSARAAVNSGAGLVTVATVPEKFTAINVDIPEAMTIDYNNLQDLDESIQKNNVIVIGPGLGSSDSTVNLIKTVIKNISDQIIIMDASALTMVSEKKIDLNAIKNLILTPHQGEWQRLSGLKIPDQTSKNNLKKINSLAPNSLLIVKKHLSEIYYQNNVYQLLNGNPGMATGGMGDTLTGIIAAFVGQFGFSLKVVSAALYLHSHIADKIYQKDYVVLPTKLASKIPQTMQKFACSKK
ncbi:NAD(P)H-hydrate dehydratase [Companilactobacillus baiquanensis]|uniref:ADP-dependent (S)-NAD(P)H-hydrate dehydratase n=1 Tax=Companilactobacillus baiquanensis TaxID=2486005 RepID=A0ABW1UWG1_9LACO|nr:NAD(P)H-hydrate dehydratase [Companilactobacillus baiquanensis]